MIKSVEHGTQGKSEDRVGKQLRWGDMSGPRPVTDTYRDGWELIYGKKDTPTSKK